jgi:hypothetical protein
MSSARNYTQATIKKLFASSGNQCAFPDCTQNIVDKEGNMIGEICHIEAAEQGGLRYNPAQTGEEKAHYNNLILLCGNHHTVIDNKDNINKYTVDALKEMKENHENNYMYEPYKVPQTIIEKILNTTQQKTEYNYSQNVTTTNQNYGNGIQLVNTAREQKTDNIIGTQTINNYPSADTSQLDQSCQDRDIIDEIFKHILENKPLKATAPEKIKESEKLLELKEKVRLNFENKPKIRIFSDMLINTWDKKELVEEYFNKLYESDPLQVLTLEEYTQSEFRRLRNDDHNAKIDDLKVIGDLSQQYLIEDKKNNPDYQANAKAMVLYFFEICKIGKKTVQEKGKTFDLFD